MTQYVCGHARDVQMAPKDWARFERVFEASPREGKCRRWAGGYRTGGYGRFDVWDSSQKPPVRVVYLPHRLSYYRFVTDVLPEELVRHDCDNRWCVEPECLRVGTPRENMADAIRRGRLARGERRPMAKLRDAEIPVIRGRRADGETFAAIAADYGVHWTAIQHVASGRTWSHA